MNTCQIEVIKLHPEAKIPRYMTALAAGMDICAAIDHPVTLQPGARHIIPTGLACALPEGFEIQVRPRSGLAIKHGIGLVNSPGTIDADYRGEVGIILINYGQDAFTVNCGDRIAQIVVAPVVQAQFVEVEKLGETARGIGGFGHTGNKS